jgi:hypothetical protein
LIAWQTLRPPAAKDVNDLVKLESVIRERWQAARSR